MNPLPFVGAAFGLATWWNSRTFPAVYAGQHKHLRATLSKLPALREPYVPPIWCHAWWAQLLALSALEPLRPQPNVGFEVQRLRLPDEGECGLAWAKYQAESGSSALTSQSPILCIFHSITATLEDTGLQRLCQHALVRGFRPVVCLRRGHLGVPLRTSKFHILGHVGDARIQVNHAQLAYPDAPVYGLGESAGTGPLVRMLGDDGQATKMRASVCICPGFDTGSGRCFKQVWPVGDQAVRRLVRLFWFEGQHTAVMKEAASQDPAIGHSFRVAIEASDLETLHEGLAALAGYETADQMHTVENPMGVARKIKVPSLVISSQDDPVCTLAPEYVGDELFDGGTDPRALVLMDRGSHLAFFDGWLGENVLSGNESWAERLAFDFLETVHTDSNFHNSDDGRFG